MKKLLSTFISGVMAVSSVSVLAGSAKEPDNSLWNKFLKYDLCITDYSSLSAEDKALCHFIFDTEQSSDQLIYCARARKELAHDQYIGDRLTLDELEGAYGIFDRYNQPTYCWQNYIHCVPDIVYLDANKYNEFPMEYWLDDTGETYVIFVEKNEPATEKRFEVYDREDGLIQTIKATEWETDAKDFRDSDEDMERNGFIYKNGGWYMLLPDGTAVFEYAESEDAALFTVESEVNGCTVTAIENGAFSGCAFTEIVLPESIEVIGPLAFASCENLQKVNFPVGLKFIGEHAFINNDSFTELHLDCPELVAAGGSFAECMSLEKVYVNAPEISNAMFAGDNNIKSVEIGNSVERIGVQAFNGMNNVDSIDLPDSVRIIGADAFTRVEGGVFIPPTVEIIGQLKPSNGPVPYVSIGDLSYDNLRDPEVAAFSKHCKVRGFCGTEAERYAEKWNLEFEEIGTDAGDVNIDSKVNMSDAVSLQRYLLGRYVPTGAYYGDMTGDGNVNVYDMIALKDEIVK